MKTKLLLSLSTFLFVVSLFAQTSGGPDTYGYTWKNNTDASGPAYNWKNIKNVGTQITGLHDDDQKGPFNLNWNFHYYWSDYGKVWVGANGFIAFQNPGSLSSGASGFPSIPSASTPSNFIAGMLCDLTFVAKNGSAVPGASAWYWTNNVDTLIVQYDSIPFWVTGTTGYAGYNTFQIILSGADSSITFQYKAQYDDTTTPYDMTKEGLHTGMENLTGQIGLEVTANTFPAANTAVKFYYPHPVTYQVIDVTPAWNQNSDNGGFFVSRKGAPVTLKTDIANSGNQNISTAISVAGKIVDANSNQLWSSSASVASLTVGADSPVTFPATYAPDSAGSFIYNVTTTLASDINPGNNSTDNEMIVVDTTQALVSLSFCTATSTTSGLNWGGAGGGGVYIVPPFYPATIKSINYFIADNTGNMGFSAVLIDDNGTGNSFGTLLDSVYVPSTAVVAGAYDTVMLTTPYTVTSGGIYAGWLADGDQILLGTDGSLPLSYRNFENIGGSWSSYRNNSTEDIMIQVNIVGSNTFGVNDLKANTLSVAQNYPNPSANYTMIDFSLQRQNGNVEFSLRNMLGQEIDAINLGNQSAGTHTLKVNTSAFSEGIYFYTFKMGGNEVTKKMIINR